MKALSAHMVILRRATAGPLPAAKRDRHSSPCLPSFSALNRPTSAATPAPDCSRPLHVVGTEIGKDGLCRLAKAPQVRQAPVRLHAGHANGMYSAAVQSMAASAPHTLPGRQDPQP